MSVPLIHGLPRRVSVSDLLDAQAGDLSDIRKEDRLTWAEVGSVLGKGDDQAAKYADGSAEMGWTAYKRGELTWGSRFTGSVDRLLEKSKAVVTCNQAQHCILKAAVAIEECRATHGDISIDELRANRATLESARDAIDAQLSRLKPQSVA